MTPPLQAQPLPDLHFDASPCQVDTPTGPQIFVRVQICDNFGLTMQLMLPSKIANAFGMQMRDAAQNAETTLVQAKSAIALA
jgi:hypothetical protein